MEKLPEEPGRQNAVRGELLDNLSESKYLTSVTRFFLNLVLHKDWRADSARQHEEIIEAVRSTAREQVPFNIQGVSCLVRFSTPILINNVQYLDEFSKTLASEVRVLLGEVGKLHEEKRCVQL
jgi:hypothetical protein